MFMLGRSACDRHSSEDLAYSLSRVHHRNYRGQLQVDHKVDMAVDLLPQRSLLRG